jgi:ribosomal protein S27E
MLPTGVAGLPKPFGFLPSIGASGDPHLVCEAVVSDTPPSGAKPPALSISPEQIDSFFREKWTHGQCEVCNTNDWIYEKPSPYSIIPISDGIEIPAISSVVQMFVRVMCKNCGNTKFFLAQKIKDWLEAGK